MTFTDSTIMPYGKYQGKKMSDIPASYLIWLHNNGKCSPLVAAYIKENINALEKKIADAERRRENRAMLRYMYK